MPKKKEVLGIINCWAKVPEECIQRIRDRFKEVDSFRREIHIHRTKQKCDSIHYDYPQPSKHLRITIEEL